MRQEGRAVGTAKESGWINWVVMASIVLFIAFAFKFLLPQGYSDDLSRIGQGKAAVVLVRDNQTVQSHDLLAVMDGIRGHYADEVEFMIVDHNTPQGSGFMVTHNAPRSNLVLLDAQGNAVKVVSAPQTERSLSQEIDTLLGGAK
jgi:hypothetical protein